MKRKLPLKTAVGLAASIGTILMVTAPAGALQPATTSSGVKTCAAGTPTTPRGIKGCTREIYEQDGWINAYAWVKDVDGNNAPSTQICRKFTVSATRASGPSAEMSFTYSELPGDSQLGWYQTQSGNSFSVESFWYAPYSTYLNYTIGNANWSSYFTISSATIRNQLWDVSIAPWYFDDNFGTCRPGGAIGTQRLLLS